MAGLRDLLCVLIGIGRWFTGWNFAFTQIAVYTGVRKLSMKALIFVKTGYLQIPKTHIVEYVMPK